MDTGTLGRPVVVTDAASTLSSAGDIIVADLTQYGIGMRREITMEMSRGAYFASDEIGFKLTFDSTDSRLRLHLPRSATAQARSARS